MQNIFDDDHPFFVGANYWASNAGTFMWRDWDASAVERDFRLLHENGAQVLRVFPLWSDFQHVTDHRMCSGKHYEFRFGEEPLGEGPAGQAAMVPEMLERFHTFCHLAEKYDLKLIVGLLTGWMSGRLYAPPALEHRNLLTDPVALRWEVLFIRCFVREMKGEPAIAAWDWGNECNCLAPETDDEMWVWGQLMTSAIKLEDSTRPVVSGLHNSLSASITAMGDVCDVLTTHPYPIFTPHCSVDYIDSFRNAFHAACQTRWVVGMGHKPAFVEEIGSFGPTVTSDRIAGLYARNALWNSYAHNCHGFLWWCANDQTELLQTPYAWNSMERELGLLKVDGTVKPMLKEIGKFAEVGKHHLAPYRKDAVALQSVDGDHWGVAYITFLLAKRAGFDIEFHNGIGPIPEAQCYMLPSVSGTRIIPRHQYHELLRRVREEGATLYVSSCAYGIQPFEGFGVEIESVAQAASPGRIISKEYKLDLTVARERSIRTGVCTAEVLARDEEGRAVFTAAKYGRGKLIFLAQPLENALIDAPRVFEENSPDYAGIYRIVRDLAGIRREVTVEDPMVTLTEHPAPDGSFEVVAVNNSRSDKTVALHWNDAFELTGCLCGTLQGDRLSLEAHSGAILTFGRKA